MIFKDVSPCLQLQKFVYLYKLRHFLIPSHMETFPKPYPAQPEQCMIFYTRGKEIAHHPLSHQTHIRSGSIISGQYTHRMDRSSASPELLFIMVVFKPGALYRLTGIPQDELVNRDIDLEAVFPEKASLVNRQLIDCSNYINIIKIIENFLISLASSVKNTETRSDKIFDLMLWNNENFSLDHLAGQACLSARQFERRSHLYFGICPKLYVRLARFNRSYRLRLQNPHLATGLV